MSGGERRVYTVSELTAGIKGTLEGTFPAVWVEGEISNLRVPSSGHAYFTLKDEGAQLSAVLFRGRGRRVRFEPEDGMHVLAFGGLDVYAARGQYQLVVELMEPQGLGALQLAFEQLKRKLEAEGLFDEGRKRKLPVYPRVIGIVTSPTGAAIRDMLNIIGRRFGDLRILIAPVRVQGDGAPAEIVQALVNLQEMVELDVIVVGRGGGSIEDLWAFNDETVARAIVACRVPVISAVGHETDFTIADFVADVRASTPSAAAEVVVRTRQEFDHHVAQLQQKMFQRMRYLLLEWRHRLQELAAHPGFRRLEDMLRVYRQQADEFIGRLALALQGRLERARRRFTVAETRIAAFDLRARIAALRLRLEQRSGDLRVRVERFLVLKRQRMERLRLQLDERSPLRVLERGYAIVYDAAGNVVRAAEQVAIGDEVAVQLARGRLAAEVKKKEAK